MRSQKYKQRVDRACSTRNAEPNCNPKRKTSHRHLETLKPSSQGRNLGTRWAEVRAMYHGSGFSCFVTFCKFVPRENMANEKKVCIPSWVAWWQFITGLICIIDATYIILRPRTMKSQGGDLNWLYSPCKMSS